MTSWLVVAMLLAQNEGDLMFGPAPTPFVAPGQLFQVVVPAGWSPFAVENDPNAVEFRATVQAGDGSLIIRKIKVPSGAKARQLALNALDERLKKLPRWRLITKKDASISGLPSAVVTGTYAFHGNIQYPRMLEEVFVVAGTEAFILHFECFEPAASQYGMALNTFYTTFQPRPVGGGEGPFAVPGPGPDPNGGESFKLPNPNEIPF